MLRQAYNQGRLLKKSAMMLGKDVWTRVTEDVQESNDFDEYVREVEEDNLAALSHMIFDVLQYQSISLPSLAIVPVFY